MTIEKKEITIPSWLVMAIISIAITLGGAKLTSTRVQAQTAAEVTHVKEEVDKKASIESVQAITQRENDMQNTLQRIEEKLDRHIEQQINVR